jgi:uncharacterized protein YecE (DUF72 family)
MQTQAPEIRVGCSGWYYRHWQGVVYPEDLSPRQWFAHYQRALGTVELNAPFYHWPRPATVRHWAHQARAGFQYSVKVNRTITHLKRFRGTRKLIGDFYQFAAVLGDKMGCFLFQLPPSFNYTAARLRSLLGQLDARLRNVVEFRHRSWWNDEVFAAFRRAGIIFCSVSAPRLPDDVVHTADAVYLRFHGAQQWYAHDYTDEELEAWAEKIRARRAREIWAYFNNDRGGCAFWNARSFENRLRRR